MAKVGNLDPRINDNHTYLPWVVTHSIQDGRYQAHIRKFFRIPEGDLGFQIYPVPPANCLVFT